VVQPVVRTVISLLASEHGSDDGIKNSYGDQLDDNPGWRDREWQTGNHVKKDEDPS